MTNTPLPENPRIAIIGTTSSGKTTLAADLARRLDIPHTESDALYWGPDWTESLTEIFREQISLALESEKWVIDGNYSQVRDIVWSRANMVIWLDFTLPLILWRMTHRTIRRLISGEEIWHGNRETWRKHFLSRDSLYLWAFNTYWMRRREYPLLLAQPEHAHLTTLRLTSPKDTRTWLANVNSPS